MLREHASDILTPARLYIEDFRIPGLSDTEIVKRALVEASASGIRDVVFAARTYTIEGPVHIPDNTSLYGGGATVLWADWSGPGFASFSCVNAEDVKISGFRFVKGPETFGGPNPDPSWTPPFSIYIQNSMNIKVEDCEFVNTKAVSIIASIDVDIQDSHFFGCRDQIVVDVNNRNNGSTNLNITIKNNFFTHGFREPIDLNWGVIGALVQGNILRGGSLGSPGAQGADELLDVGGGITRDITIRGNVLDGLGTHHRAIGIKLGVTNATVEENIFQNFVTSSRSAPLIELVYSSGLLFKRNDIEAPARAMYIAGSSVDIVENIFRTSGMFPVFDVVLGSKVGLSGNTYLNLSPVASLPGEFGGNASESLYPGALATSASIAFELFGGDGRDTLVGANEGDTLYGEAGSDRLDGGEGNDRLDGGTEGDLVLGGGGADRLFGGDGNDLLAGGLGNDTLEGEAGGDLLLGLDGNDLLRGGPGNDTLLGGRGNDTIDTGSGFDRADGGAGNDWLRAGPDGGELRGGEGADTLESEGGPGTLLIGGIDDDTYILRGVGDRILEEQGGGVDTLRVDLPTGTYVLPNGLENLVLLGGTVTGVGNAASNRLSGNATGNLLFGAGGHDTLDGRAGDDTLIGGQGRDVFLFRPSEGRDRVRDFAPGEDILVMAGATFASAAAVVAASRAGPSGVEIALPGGIVVLEGIRVLHTADVLIA